MPFVSANFARNLHFIAQKLFMRPYSYKNTIILFFMFVFIFLLNESIAENNFIPNRVAHAGGGINKKTYTNSYDALNLNYDLGFRYFELDFSFTADDELVCLHDWQDSFRRTFGFTAQRKVTLSEFENLVDAKSRFKKCTLNGLIDWLEVHPSAYLVTDIREDNIRALTLIRDLVPEAHRRIIPQFYQPENFDQIKELGFDQIIWSLYRFNEEDVLVLEWADTFYGPIAIAMPRHRAATTLPAELLKRGIPTYVHTINSPDKLSRYTNKYQVTEIYTDFLPPPAMIQKN